MRITQHTMSESLMRYLRAQNEALYDRQRIIASQKRINKPSDDPIATGKILDYRQTLASIDQYLAHASLWRTRFLGNHLPAYFAERRLIGFIEIEIGTPECYPSGN